MKPFTLFVSDLHLDASRPARVREFVRFLENEASQAQALYILGDLFEVWIGDDDPAEGLDGVPARQPGFPAGGGFRPAHRDRNPAGPPGRRPARHSRPD